MKIEEVSSMDLDIEIGFVFILNWFVLICVFVFNRTDMLLILIHCWILEYGIVLSQFRKSLGTHRVNLFWNGGSLETMIYKCYLFVRWGNVASCF